MVISRERGQQKAVKRGIGKNFQSPKKKRSSSYRTSRTAWKVLNPAAEKQRLLTEMMSMYTNPSSRRIEPSIVHRPCASDLSSAPDGISQPASESVQDEPSQGDCENPMDDQSVPSKVMKPSASNPGRRTAPEPSEMNLYSNWNSLLPTLIEDMLFYTSATAGLPSKIAGASLPSNCPRSNSGPCLQKTTSVLCLYFDHFKYIAVESCQCRSVAQILIRNGLFPTAPSQARMAFAIDFLNFYTALFERSCDAVNAMAAALNTFYTRRGFYLLDNKGMKYKEPFRKGLGYASQWLSKLTDMIAQRVDTALQQADQYGQAAAAALSTQQPAGISEAFDSPKVTELSPGQCARSLRLLCPACFGSDSYGKSLLDGGDFQVCTDGNFHHRHLTSAGSGIPFHNPKHFIPKAFVDQVGHDIELARHRPKRVYKPKVPDYAIDECEHAFRAANGDKKRANVGNERYDDQGYMSLVCRHDIPIFFANIDTPGEQQKFAVALIKWLFQFIPKHATATVLYDVGCVLDRSNQLYSIIPDDIALRVQFVTTAMHAYGHEWACQLAYNPRLCRGLGLTDGEGVERVWSRLTKLIPIVRASSSARRLWLTDRQLSFIASESLDDLGSWIKHRLDGAKSQQDKAEDILSRIEISAGDLRHQWNLQKASQLSVKSRTHIQISKDLDALLSLQGHWDSAENAIQAAAETLKNSKATKSLSMLRAIQEAHEQNGRDLESLYVSLSEDGSPLQVKAGPEFKQALKLAHNLKITIRRQAISSFFEWDKLDQAVGGRNIALGTKLHQQTRKAISRRQPALMSAIKKYNSYCATLERLYNPAYNLPLPQPLPTKLSELRESSLLAEDVWTTSDSKLPLWLNNTHVRTGIRAMLKQDRCLEEKKRLEYEAKNLCCWLGRELLSVELALHLPSNASLFVHLTRHRDRLIQLKSCWVNPYLSTEKLNAQCAAAEQLASKLLGRQGTIEVKRLYSQNANLDIEILNEIVVQDDEDETSQDMVSPASLLVSDVLLSTEDSEGALVSDDTCAIENTWMIELVWVKPTHIAEDNLDATSLQLSLPPASTPTSQAFGYHGFGVQDLQRLHQSGMMLNDTCLNGCARVLKDVFDNDSTYGLSSNRCALFTTFDLIRARYKARDQELWRTMSPIAYWDKDVWILPIHRPQQLHWVLCVAYPKHQAILLYDSLADLEAWRHDLKDISNLFTRLVQLANQHDHRVEISTYGWIAQPVTTIPIQSNSHDCGLWVIAWIMSALRGFATCNSHLTEKTMPCWRNFLAILMTKHLLHQSSNKPLAS
ncbi:hypothetical protein CVT26_012351 [Gymnopilus dilepis]|uniref:Ubiquitin-like protease family profile domain-containing protein n=1 Tax=Gymnopilus dilepis TaxID=231916 RepID=A0A409WDE0_9AGAR|nr:hypothetical protein CVT26_012351 [Gymnopilus dilepis]